MLAPMDLGLKEKPLVLLRFHTPGEKRPSLTISRTDRLMSVAVKEMLRANRPPGAPGRADKYLPDIAQDLR